MIDDIDINAWCVCVCWVRHRISWVRVTGWFFLLSASFGLLFAPIVMYFVWSNKEPKCESVIMSTCLSLFGPKCVPSCCDLFVDGCAWPTGYYCTDVCAASLLSAYCYQVCINFHPLLRRASGLFVVVLSEFTGWWPLCVHCEFFQFTVQPW